MAELIALDFRTLSFVTLMFSFIFGGGLLIFAHKHPKFRCLSLIGWGLLLMGLGYVLLGLRQVVSYFVSIIVANSLIYVALILIYRGLFRFLKISVPGEKILSLVGLGFLVAVLFYFTYHTFDVNARIMGFSASYALLCFITAYGLTYSSQDFAPLPIRFLVVNFASIGLFHVYRVFWTSGTTPLSNFMEAGSIHAITVLTSQFIVLFVTFMVIWIASDFLERELKAMTKIDPLTGVNNRRALEDFCAQEFVRSKRTHRPFSLIVCDIDHFKQVNDNYGHPVGDQVLVAVSNLLKQNVRKVDMIARFGGEEFVLVLPETNSYQAQQVAEKLRLLVIQQVIFYQTQASLSVTASFGVACLQAGDRSWEALLKAADQALYQAKEKGRNQVAAANEIGAMSSHAGQYSDSHS